MVKLHRFNYGGNSSEIWVDLSQAICVRDLGIYREVRVPNRIFDVTDSIESIETHLEQHPRRYVKLGETTVWSSSVVALFQVRGGTYIALTSTGGTVVPYEIDEVESLITQQGTQRG